MNEIIPKYIFLNIPVFILIILAFVSGIVSYLYYKKTVPPVSFNYRIVLAIFRGVAIFLILLLLFAPNIKLIWSKNFKPTIVIAADQSASMKIIDNNVPRINRVNAIYNDLKNEIESDYNLISYSFDVDTGLINPDSIAVGNLATNPDLSISNILKKNPNIDALILITDGIVTEGRNPLFSEYLKKTKIYTIGIGDTSDVPDIFIKNIRANKIVYKDSPTKITSEISSHSIRNLSTDVILKHGNKIVASKKIDIDKEGGIIPVEFEITPSELGLSKYEITVTEAGSDQIKENNKQDIFLEVLKSKLNIGLLSSAPGYETKFFKLLLAANEDFIPQSFIKQKNYPSNKTDLINIVEKSDALIFVDFPEKSTPEPVLRSLKSTLEKKHTPTICVVSGRINSFSDELVKILFPEIIWQRAYQTEQIFAVPTISGKLNPVLNIYDSEELNNEFWRNCSPIEYSFMNVNFGATTKEILKSPNSKINQPIMLFNNYHGTNNVLMLGAGFWRWKFQLAEDRQFKDGWNLIINNLIRWLTNKSGSQNVNIIANNKIISMGENLNLEIQVYDAGYNPVSDSNVRLKVSSASGEFEAEAEPTGDGIYSWQYTPYSEGSFKVKATAAKNDVPIGESEIDIQVVQVNKELIYTKQDYELLQKLARSTSGEYFNYDNYKQVTDLLPKANKIQNQTKSFDLWNKLPVLLLIILLFTIEWFIRKRKGLA